jgi:N-formylglutamate amidohydrolase
VLLSVPHSGRDYPDWLLDLAPGGRAALTTLEDPLVDRLAWRAIQRGVGAVIARTPRAAVDCTRGEDEIDPAVVAGPRRERLTARARGGLGIVPARTPQHGFLWRQAIAAQQLDERLEQAHRPYHVAIAEQLERLVDRFGCALLLDCHSMPPPAAGVPPVILGDRYGRSAGSWVSREAVRIAGECGFPAGINDPFAGGHVVDRHGDPRRNVHAIQLEIDRRRYLDPTLREPGPGFDSAASLIEALATGLGELLRAQPFATAAE